MCPLAEEELAKDLTVMKNDRQELKADLQGAERRGCHVPWAPETGDRYAVSHCAAVGLKMRQGDGAGDR